MAKTVITTDDLDGASDAETIEFSFDGVNYAIDLTKKNRTAMEKALKPYIQAASTTSRRRSTRSAASNGNRRSRRTGGSRVDTAAVRAWAVENGLEVSERGRISNEVVEAYTAAQ